MKLQIRRNGAVVAQMDLSRLCGDEFEIAHLLVSPAYRQQGLANQLLAKAKARCGSLVGLVDPDRTGMDAAQITAWLVRNGFRHCRYDFHGQGRTKRALIWTPQPTKDNQSHENHISPQ